MFRRNEVDVVDVADLLEFDIPLGQFFGGQVKSLALVGNILFTTLVSISGEKRGLITTDMVLAKDTAKIAA